ncbi:phosphoribosylglycinamide formyltransferase [Ammoniphilus oxalaticus]|uniref:Phosphoribosylglycinamide formyltransferase n=1 Tax=Ammoniphilus oxalaticus TaxID=66863 RepID=A0A419SDR3_9BACL|nr:phosphoribosylglycinamide formyltransferase [Ammoniphilus oxalaticus]RKD21087.1 phosphoribosylglycinamide formyltransferase [Ammoniphilus oxalaticus]
MKIAVFASGSGSNFGAIVQALKTGQLKGVEISLLVCDRPDAYVIKRAEQEGIPVFSFQSKEYAGKAAYEQAILRHLREREVELIVLAGYMRLIGEALLAEYEGKMINLHPSLLPAFPGKDAIEQAFDYGVKITGVTVHYVDAGMDTGPIIEQRTVVVEAEDTLDTLAQKIHQQEHQLLPEVIEKVAAGKVEMVGRKVKMR